MEVRFLRVIGFWKFKDSILVGSIPALKHSVEWVSLLHVRISWWVRGFGSEGLFGSPGGLGNPDGSGREYVG